MHYGRRLRFIFIGKMILVTFLFILLSVGNYVYDKYTTERSTKELTNEEIIRGCAISVCTPCQYLNIDPNIEILENEAVQFTQYQALTPSKTILEDLPKSGIDRIQKIIHQKWNTKKVPIQFKDYIKSFLENHLSWTHMFWTDQSTRKFINDHYPNLLSLYDNYVHPLNRADAMRYMALFYYGGVYTDLDTHSLRPLDPMIRKYSCFLAQEPQVHSIVYTNFYEQAANGIMGCRKRHPFMKLVIENLNHFFYYAHELDSTGPRFLTFSLRQYLKNITEMEITDKDYVYLTPSEYFLPTVDPGISKLLAMQCRITQCLSPLRKWQCEQWRRDGVRTEPYPFSFTNHVWAHIAYQDISSFTYIDIVEISPDVLMYE
ncbi:hypothetical protein CHS0354_003597 [Potamilus streckersoni]|uniref:Uncharacterized protein n=1 Tax=Potamilus streckersoni TaxID=2493646 RepID=A0AAE0RY28_9BIVA|nr:hypothetical protein CHS0354_003597 [Potamilus streckersoni]